MFLEYLSHIIVSNVTNWGNKYSIDINDDNILELIIAITIQQPTNLKIRGLWQNTVPC